MMIRVMMMIMISVMTVMMMWHLGEDVGYGDYGNMVTTQSRCSRSPWLSLQG